MLLADLATVALLGTERQKAGVRVDGPLGVALEAIYPQGELPASNRERALLDCAAVASVYHRAGRGVRVGVGELPAPSAPESKDVVSPRAGALAGYLLADTTSRPLLREWLQLVADADKVAPPAILPRLLDLGVRDRKLRPLLLEVIGARGRWLANQIAGYGYASSGAGAGDRTDWDDGSLDVRISFLERLRATEPDRARGLLEATFGAERAGPRGRLLASLQVGLQSTDEAFLEACLDDRSRVVANVAAGLLARLVSSADTRRMQDRLRVLVTLEAPRRGLIRRRPATLRVELPTSFDETMKRDALVETPPSGKGARAWWLEQMVATVPPGVWTAQWHTDAMTLLDAASKLELREPLIAGWVAATRTHADPAWAEALLALDLAPVELWDLLAAPRREQLFTGQIPAADPVSLLQLIGTLDWRWSGEFTVVVAKAVRAIADRRPASAASAGWDGARRAALFMNPARSDEVAQVLLQGDSQQRGWLGLFEQIADTVRFRRHMRDEIGELRDR